MKHDATTIRFRHGSLVHATLDLRRTLCGRKADGGIVAPDNIITCRKCHEAVSFN